MSKTLFGNSVKWKVIFVTAVFWLLVSCGGGNVKNAPASPTLVSITVSPASATVEAGLTQQHTAMANYSDGSSKPLCDVKWETSDTNLAMVYSNNGLIATADAGKVTVSATLGAVTGRAVLMIGLHAEGQIPADFSVPNAMRSLHGTFDPFRNHPQQGAALQSC